MNFAALQDVIVVPPLPPPSAASAHAEVVAYIMDRKGEAHGMSNGRIHYVVSAGLGELIAKHGTDLLREAVTLYSDAPYPPNPRRLEELAVLVLSGIKPEGTGWISEKRQHEGAVVFKVPLAAAGWIRRRFPKERTAAEWTKFLETFDSTQMPEVSEPTEFTVSTSPPRKGTRYRLLFLQSSLDNYRKKVASGQERPDTMSIDTSLRLLRRESEDLDTQNDPAISKEVQSAVSEAEAILQGSQGALQ